MLITKREEVTKQGFCKMLWRKLRPQGSFLLQFIHSSGWGGGEPLFEFDWKEEGAGAYKLFLPLGWALIRGWALIWINTVFQNPPKEVINSSYDSRDLKLQTIIIIKKSEGFMQQVYSRQR